MKSAIVALVLLFTQTPAFAGQTDILLNCTLSFGADQAVRVLKTEAGLVLEELTNTGSFIRRKLSEEEFKSNEIRLRLDSEFDSGTLKLEENGSWFYSFSGAKGYASCR